MKELLGILFVIGVVLSIVGIFIFPTFYGLYLAFKAPIILGILVLIVEPTPAVLGWLAIFGHSDIPAKLAAWMNLPF